MRNTDGNPPTASRRYCRTSRCPSVMRGGMRCSRLVVSGIAALAMTGGALVLRGDVNHDDGDTKERNLSVAAVLLDTIADAAAAAGVAAVAGIILATGG